MDDVVIRFEDISKQYRLGMIGTGTLSHDLKRWWTINVLGREDPYLKIGQVNDRSVKAESEYVWALRDIDFEVIRGEVLGIIGKNGAGKSTLLKILSRVTTPTTGRILTRGRIASLLEVGTGFHPEMTGRENIYMNGSIMGMTKLEITRKFDEIVDFAGVEEYIDTPVKRYSSGMVVRLGFSVAAHLEPEILVVDEVLAVGDAEFQKKAIGKMDSVSRNSGRTVLFVSHNMAAVKSLCKNGIILQNGYISKSGDINSIVSDYLKGDNGIVNFRSWSRPVIKSNGFELIEVGIKAKKKDFSEIIQVDDELELIIHYRTTRFFDALHLTIHVKDEQGNKLFSSSGIKSGIQYDHEQGEYYSTAFIPGQFFNWGSFFIDLYVVENMQNAFIVENDIISFTLVNRINELGSWMGREPGGITPHFEWKKKKVL